MKRLPNLHGLRRRWLFIWLITFLLGILIYIELPRFLTMTLLSGWLPSCLIKEVQVHYGRDCFFLREDEIPLLLAEVNRSVELETPWDAIPYSPTENISVYSLYITFSLDVFPDITLPCYINADAGSLICLVSRDPEIMQLFVWRDPVGRLVKTHDDWEWYQKIVCAGSDCKNQNKRER